MPWSARSKNDGLQNSDATQKARQKHVGPVGKTRLGAAVIISW